MTIHNSLRTHTGLSIYSTGIEVCANSEIAIGSGGGRRIPDLAVQVRLSPEVPQKYFTGVVWEVGFAQSLRSLKARARMWLSCAAGGGIREVEVNIHLVVLVHVFEQQGPEAYYDESEKEIISRSKAQKKKWDWPREWFGGRGILEEVQRRRRKHKRGGLRDIREELRCTIEERLLIQDGEGGGGVVPALVEKLGASVLLYGRKEEGSSDDGDDSEDGVRDGGEDSDRSDCEVDNVRQEHNYYNDGGDGGDGGGGGGDGGDNAEGDGEGDSCGGSDDSDTSAHSDQGSASALPDKQSDGSDSPTSQSLSDSDSTNTAPVQSAPAIKLKQLLSLPLIQDNTPLTNLQLTPLELTIAELYGPIPSTSIIPDSLLARIPPLIRPYAREKISFPLQELAESVLRRAGQVRERRAVDRAERIISRSWEEVERQRGQMRQVARSIEQGRKRDSRRVRRRKWEEEDDCGAKGVVEGRGDSGREKRLGVKRIRKAGKGDVVA